MNTYIDSVRPFFHEGYCFHNSTKQLSLLQYADDTCIVTNGPATCQAILRRTDQWLEWSKMRANVSKCKCLALKASTGRVYDPNLSIAGEKIPFVGSNPVKFPGGTIQIPKDQSSARQLLKKKLTTLLEKVDQIPVTRKQKLKLYKLAICPRLSWDLTISNFPITWITKALDADVTRFLKRWSGLARPADSARLFLPPTSGGLNLPSVSDQKTSSWKGLSTAYLS